MKLHEIQVGRVYTFQSAVGGRRRFRVLEVRRNIVHGELLDSPRGRCWFEKSEVHRLTPEREDDFVERGMHELVYAATSGEATAEAELQRLAGDSGMAWEETVAGEMALEKAEARDVEAEDGGFFSGFGGSTKI